MTLLALALIVLSSLLHATWNLFAKRVCGGLAFTWLFTFLSAVVYTPLAAFLIGYQKVPFGADVLAYVAVATLMHIVYYYLLQTGYRVGDMSLVYPLARGTAPVVTAIAAVVLLREGLNPVAAVGIGLVVLGTFCLTYSPTGLAGRTRSSVLFGVLTGTVTAAYTLWDKYAVATLLVPPLLYEWSCNVVRAVFLAPVAARQASTVRRHWREHRKEAWGIAVLCPFAYILVLTAMKFTPVSYVAAAREVSIVFSALMGGRLLGEGRTLQRVAGSGVILAGLAVISLS